MSLDAGNKTGLQFRLALHAVFQFCPSLVAGMLIAVAGAVAPALAEDETTPGDNSSDICCIGFYGEKAGLMSKAECTKIGGDSRLPEICKPEDATPTMSDGANVQGGRDIGDIPVMSPDPPIYNAECRGNGCDCDTTRGPLDCDGILALCEKEGHLVIDCMHVIVGDDIGRICSCGQPDPRPGEKSDD